MSVSTSPPPPSSQSTGGDYEGAPVRPGSTTHHTAGPLPIARDGTQSSPGIVREALSRGNGVGTHQRMWLKPTRRTMLIGSLAAFVGLLAVWATATLIRSDSTVPEPTKTTVQPQTIGFDRVALRVRDLTEAGLTLETCSRQPLLKTIEVPGVLEADHDLEVIIRARVGGVIRAVPVVKGKRVSQGEVLAIIESPELAQARLEHRARLREAQAARIDAEWQTQVASGVERLVEALRHDPDALEIERRFAELPLGDARRQLIQSYAAWRTAQINLDRQGIYVREGIVGPSRWNQAAREAAAAQSSFESARDQVARDARQAALKSQQALKLAQGRVFDSRARLEVLGEDPATIALIERLEDEPTSNRSGGLDWTAHLVRAPFDGIVLDRPIGPGQQVDRGEALIPFANLDRLHLIAKIPESLIGALPAMGSNLSFTTPAHPGRRFSARLEAIGGQLDPANRSLPVLAEVENPDQALKLGMAVRVELIIRDPQPVLSVPRASVQDLEGRPVVFELAPNPTGTNPAATSIQDDEPRQLFLVRRVELGEIRDDRVVIHSGLHEGAIIAAQGSFLLKSELILQNEPEEE